jgi:RNA polymerase sigma-70 factor, ECF subfamily
VTDQVAKAERRRVAVPAGDAGGRVAAQEAQLIVQLAGGDIEEPVKELCARYERDLYRFGLQMLGDERLAEEMVQESVQRLWRSAGRYDPRHDSCAVFLFAVARSVVADIRESSRPHLPAEDLRLPPLPDGADQILDSLMVRAALGELSWPCATVLRLALGEGLTQSQVAGRLGIPLDTVKVRTFRGMHTLRSFCAGRVVLPAGGQADLAHPEAADRVLGLLAPAPSAEFQDHLTNCGYCQVAVAEFGYVGGILQHLPPAAEPPPDLGARAVASLLAAAAQDRTKTQPRPVPAASAPAGPRSPEPAPPALAPPELASLYRGSLSTRQVSQSNGPGKPVGAPAKVSRLPEVNRTAQVNLPAEVKGSPRRPRRSSQYAAAGVVAAGLVAAIVFWPSMSGPTSAQPPPLSGTALAGTPVVIMLHATSGAAASGLATARKLPGGWSIKLSVYGLSQLAPGEFYECWFAGAGTTTSHPDMISAGTFSLGTTGPAAVSMWSAADPRQFRTLEITAESTSDDGQPGRVILRGRART